MHTQALLGHRDVGVTNCPGKNIYGKLAGWRIEFGKSLTPVFNTENGYIEPKPSIENNNTSPKTNFVSDLFTPTPQNNSHISTSNLTPSLTISEPKTPEIKPEIKTPKIKSEIKTETPKNEVK